MNSRQFKKHHSNKKPNPTTFSNLRSQNYLNQYDFEKRSTIIKNDSELIFQLSADCIEGNY